jgi:hypothetical protein
MAQHPDVERWALEEFGRLVVHMNTLSAGSIVVIATFADKFNGRGPGWPLAIAVAGFALTILACLFAYVGIVLFSKSPRRLDDEALEIAFGWAFIFFAASLVSLAIFAAIAVT